MELNNYLGQGNQTNSYSFMVSYYFQIPIMTRSLLYSLLVDCMSQVMVSIHFISRLQGLF